MAGGTDFTPWVKDAPLAVQVGANASVQAGVSGFGNLTLVSSVYKGTGGYTGLSGVNGQLLFSTTRNGTVPYIVTVQAPDNPIRDGDRTFLVNHTLIPCNDPRWATALADNFAVLTIKVLDNEAENVTAFTEANPSVQPIELTEAGAAKTVSVKLATRPFGAVTMKLLQGDWVIGGNEVGYNGGSTRWNLTIAPASLTFTPTTWNTTQSFSVSYPADLQQTGGLTW